MSSYDETRRIVIKRGAGVPTIPASADHRNGDWIATDIYEGEFYQDTATGKMYTRQGSTIVTSEGMPVVKRYKALATQSGTSAPVITVLESFGFTGTITSGYSNTGRFTLTNSVAEFTANKTATQIGGTGGTGSTFKNISRGSTTVVNIATADNAGVYANGLLVETLILIEVYP